MWWRYLLFLVGLTSQACASDLKLVCYYTNWAVYRPGLAKFSPENINPFLCTHLIYAFAGFGKDYELKPLDSYNDIEKGNYRKFVGLKKHNQDLKTMIAIGGWNEGSKRFSRLVRESSTREKFIHSVIRYLRQNRFDGLELDWEYPGSRDGSSNGDRKGYALLIKELREAFNQEGDSRRKERLILSVAVPAGKDYIDNGYDVPEISKYVDFMNVLSYDYHTAYEAIVDHHAPLYKPPDVGRWDERNRLNLNWTISYYLELGAPRHKLIVGVPTYGRSFTLLDPDDNEINAAADGPGEEGSSSREKGYLSYHEICQNILEKDWEVRRPYSDIFGPYCFKDNQWVGFDDEVIITKKANYIREQGLGGAMVWTLADDDFRGLCGEEQSPLVTTLRNALLTGNKEHPIKSVVQTILDEVKQQLSPDSESYRKKYRRLSGYNRLRDSARTNSENPKYLLQTPKPPTTPDPGGDFICTDEGFFRNPRNCKKYYWCLDSGPAELGIVPHTFTCPAGLYFNPQRDSCDYRQNVHCEEESAPKPTTSRPSRTTRRPFRFKRPRLSFRKTTTTTTTEVPQTQAPTTHNLADLVRLLQSLLKTEQTTEEVTTLVSETLAPTSRTLPDYITPQFSKVQSVTQSITSTSSPTSTESSPTLNIPRYRRPIRPSQYLPATLSPKDFSSPSPGHLTNQVPRRPQFEAEPDSEKLFKYVEPNRRQTSSRSNKTQEESNPFSNYQDPDRSSDPEERKETDSLFIYKNPERTKVQTPTEPPLEVEPATQFTHTLPNNPIQYNTPIRSSPTPTTTPHKENKKVQLLNRKRGHQRFRPRFRIRTRTRSRENEDAVSSRVSSVTLPKDQELQDFKPVQRAIRRRLRPLRTTTTPAPRGPGVTVAESMNVQCMRQGIHRNPKNCSQFIMCAPVFEEGFRSYFYDCPDGKIFDETLGRCTTGNPDTCEITV
ncbi:oviduct-specific glycoprotein-like [Limulus polyphemus]|uniref:Oviduct-specific glycoprotein-like n=1 Tax=Limulus polyphemus TaxID=6850 RepID=A0ABM1TNB9_LIMPO|nr:oviduct-specific glycoprotein-like [Limulus polyphemus]XP_022257376.1 oviduct-specific glycoprotein-like [Limulus polyphemus]